VGSWLHRGGFLCLFTFSLVHAQPIPDKFYAPYPPIKVVSPFTQASVQHGEYLSKIGDCIACHTNVVGGTPAYAGGLAIATPFGTFYTPNITPDKETGIGTWSEEDFIRALKEGRNPHGQNYFPVFPYVYFAKISVEDLKDLYAYFMSIPPVHQENKELPFPFNLRLARLGVWGWDLLFFYPDKSEIVPDPKESALWNRGKYIVDGLGHCSMCHTPLNPLGAPKTRYYLGGGFVDGYFAPNITQKGLETATIQEVMDVFAKDQLINNAGPVAGPMAEVNHDSLHYLSDEDRLAIATYLKNVNGEDPYAIEPSDAPPSLARGRKVYITACVACHQRGEMTAPLIGDADNWYSRTKTSGLAGLYQHAIYGYNSMPVKGACVTCSDNDIKSAVDYILNASLERSQWRDLKQPKH
jgi:cytochrome c5